MPGYHRFIVARIGGTPKNEYRIVDGHVQCRVSDTRSGARWRLLSRRDLDMHLSLGTDVGRWLARRLRDLPPL